MNVVEAASAGSGVWHAPEASQIEVIAPAGAQTTAAGSIGSSLSMRNTSESPAEIERSSANGVRPTESAPRVNEVTSEGEVPQRKSGTGRPNGNLCTQTRTSSAVVACLSTSPETCSVPVKAAWTAVRGLPASLKSAAVLKVKSGAPVGSMKVASSAPKAPQSPLQAVYCRVGAKVISSSGTGRGGV